MPLFVVAGSESEARAKVEQAKADKLAELRAAGDTREVVFDVTTSRDRRRASTGKRPDRTVEAHAPPYLPRRQFGGDAVDARKKRFEKNHSPRHRNLRAGSSPPMPGR